MKRVERILIYILVLSLTVEVCVSLELLKQRESEIAILTQQNEALLAKNEELTLENEICWHGEALLWDINDKQREEIERLTNEIAQLKAQQTKPVETQKTNRGGERPRYRLTTEERDVVERVVMAEAGGECFEGQVLVTQCILNACLIDNLRPPAIIKKYAYGKGRPTPSESVKRAVKDVFDRGVTGIDEPIIYFYAPAIVYSSFHESQRFALECGGHRFFCAKE